MANQAGAEGSRQLTRSERREQSRGRILAVARRMFSDLGYQRTSYRGIAAEAGVDPKLVLHYFGSKEQLFREAASPPEQPGVPCGAPPDDRAAAAESNPERLAELMLESLGAKLTGEQPGALAMLRSMLTHPEASDVVRAGIHQQQQTLGGMIPSDDADVRIGLIGALVLGVTVSRELLGLDGVRDASPEELVSLLRPCVHALAHGDAEPRPREAD